MAITCSTENVGAMIEKLFYKSVDAVKDAVSEAGYKALEKGFDVASLKTEFNYAKIIDENFYGEYTPKFYQRSNDMGETIKAKGKASSDGSGLFSIQFDPGAMNDYERNHNGTLMELTIGYGYHGGAAGTDRSGRTADVPTYRKPFPSYYQWGRPAVQTTPPYDLFVDWLRTYFEGGEFNDVCSYYFNQILPGVVQAKLGSIG